MSVKIRVETQVERPVGDDRKDWELECVFSCYRCSEYFGEPPTGGRQRWVEADLEVIELDGVDVKDDAALGVLLGLNQEQIDKLLDGMRDAAVEDYEAGE